MTSSLPENSEKNKDDNIHKSEALKLEGMKNEHKHCRVSKLNKQDIIF